MGKRERAKKLRAASMPQPIAVWAYKDVSPETLELVNADKIDVVMDAERQEVRLYPLPAIPMMGGVLG